ncbi:hypothetical protein QBZ16_000463 [Prototheca wickerhamii]|uniref:Uncharacterized protein n=1 Tax=Prototheca wickerhamii TaxID=3111 RepID=A0AAD9MIR6_PROWI|nr:hypothetical protein QBZ16_000463 [Prototheca wickerhamii]
MGGLAAGGGLALLGLGTAVSLAEAEPAGPIDPWDRALGYWESTKKALGAGTSCSPATRSRRGGYDVMGGYLSPVSDAYWKQALAPGAERVALARAAAADSDFIMVDAWEAAQPRYTRTLVVLQRVATELARLFEAPEVDVAGGYMDPRHPGTPQRPRLPAEAAPAPAPRSVLVCGADVLEVHGRPAAVAAGPAGAAAGRARRRLHQPRRRGDRAAAGAAGDAAERASGQHHRSSRNPFPTRSARP